MKTKVVLLIMLQVLIADAAQYLVDASTSSLTWYEVDVSGTTNETTVSAIPSDADLTVIAGDGNRRLGSSLSVNSLVMDYSNASSAGNCVGPWFDGTHVLTIGGGGVTMNHNNSWIMGYRASELVRIKLAANQTWRGPSSMPCAQFSIGSMSYQDYFRTRIEPINDTDTWNLAGRLELWVLGSNDLSGVDVMVDRLARLRLVRSYVRNSVTYTTSARLHARSLTLAGGDTLCDEPNLELGKVHGISPYAQPVTATAPAEFDDDVFAPTINLSGDVKISAGNAFYGIPVLNAGSGDSILSGDWTFTRATSTISIESGASVTFSGDVCAADGVSAGIVFGGEGTLSLPASASLPGGVSLSGGTLAVTGEGMCAFAISGSGNIAVASSGITILEAPALAGLSSCGISVTSGTLVIPSVSALPSGTKVSTSGTGSLMLLDSTGFDVDAMMEGTKSVYSDSLTVTDDGIENETLHVGNGETLKVFGSGLKASSSVNIAVGGSIQFFRSAVVHAPLSVAGGVTILAMDSSVTGTVAGALNASIGSSAVTFAGDGTIRLAGGGVVANDSATAGSLQIAAGRVEIIGGTLSCSGKVSVYVGIQSQPAEAVLVVARGGTLELGNNQHLYVGYTSSSHEARLSVAGGVLKLTTEDHFYVRDCGVFELAGGEFQTRRALECSGDSARFVWSGGTWMRGSDNKFRYGALVRSGNPLVTIAGDGCVLDMTGFTYAVVSNCVGSGAWTGAPGARLSVKGGNTAKTFVMRNFSPAGMAFDQNDPSSADIEIDEASGELAVTWVTPGTNGVLRATGSSGGYAAPSLSASYIVPSGTVFRNDMAAGWNAGFSSVTQNGLAFEKGSVYTIATSAPEVVPVLALSGTLDLPEELSYFVDTSSGRPAIGDTPILTAIGGIRGASVWTSSGGLPSVATDIVASSVTLYLHYRPKGTVFILK